MRYWGLALTSLFVSGVAAHSGPYKHVFFVSIDGFHGSDVQHYVSKRPHSTMARLLATGYEYTNAYTSAPSDSFPGTINQMTGASPAHTGVWYDDIYDRTFYPPGSNCTGPAGAEVEYAENCDFNSTLLFSGGIDVKNLPRKIVDGKCRSIFPHQRLLVNTWLEIVTKYGGTTCYGDKHPTYEIVSGPSGKGLTSGYFPEIQAIPVTVNATIAYDELHVNAFLDWIDGKVPVNSTGDRLKETPTAFGGNFQAVSVAQKTAGYVNGSLDFTPDLFRATDFVDGSIKKVVDKLIQKKIYDDTLILICSKHGQAPINPNFYGKIDPALVQNTTGVDVLFMTADDIALIFLKHHGDTETAVRNLEKARDALKIYDIIYGRRLIEDGFGDPLSNPAVPDIIVRPIQGIIYTTSTAKIAEHGGLSDDDRHVACFVSNPKLKKTQFTDPVSTKQVAPTILRALGLDEGELQGVQLEHTQVLQGF